MRRRWTTVRSGSLLGLQAASEQALSRGYLPHVFVAIMSPEVMKGSNLNRYWSKNNMHIGTSNAEETLDFL